MKSSLSEAVVSFNRPRERLTRLGAEHLDNAELVALLIGGGTEKQNVIQVSKAMLGQYPLHQWDSANTKKFTATNGIGIARAARLCAAVEIGRRIFENQVSTPSITTPEAALHHLNSIRSKKREYLMALFLNARGHLLSKQVISIGSLNATVLQPRDIFAPALRIPCTQIILAHNHPSGCSTPSHADMEFTQRVDAAGKLLGIQLLDHLIVTEKSYQSLREAGVFET